jgi:hypothetical protein
MAAYSGLGKIDCLSRLGKASQLNHPTEYLEPPQVHLNNKYYATGR